MSEHESHCLEELSNESNVGNTADEHVRRSCTNTSINTSTSDVEEIFTDEGQHTSTLSANMVVQAPAVGKREQNSSIIFAGDNYGSIHTHKNPEQHHQPCPRIVEEAAMKKLKEAQGRKIKRMASENDMPNVHPRIFKVNCCQGEVLCRDEAYRPSHECTNHLEKLTEMQFDTWFQLNITLLFVGIIGVPGSGKTFCSKRLEKLLAPRDGFLTLRVSFADINCASEITLRKMLVDHVYPDLEKNVQSQAFNWIRHNHKKVCIILDGLDLVSWRFENDVSKLGYDEPQHVGNVIASLFSKHFLPNAKLIVTSRPYSILRLPQSLRPKDTYLLHDLTLEATKTLLSYLAKENFDRLWKVLTDNPQLRSLCQNPLILVLYVQAFLYSKSPAEMTTITKIFEEIFQNLRRSAHVKEDIAQIIEQLAIIAFQITAEGSVMIAKETLSKYNLTEEIAKDLMVPLRVRRGEFSRLLEGDVEFSFWHQTFQEYFAALHISNQMSLADFKKHLDTLFTETWSMVRRFVFGILLDNSLFSESAVPSGPTSSVRAMTQFFLKMFRKPSQKDILQEKAKALIVKMTKEMKEFARKLQGDELGLDCQERQQLIGLYLDAREANNPEVTKKLAESFPTKFWMDHTSFTESNAGAVSGVLEQVTKTIEDFGLAHCNLDSATFAYFVKAIKAMPGSVGKLDIRYNNLCDVDGICSILEKINEKVSMCKCFLTQSQQDANRGNHERRDADEAERAKLQEAIDRSSETNLKIKVSQTEYIEKSDSN